MLRPWQLRETVRRLRLGGIIAYPTEAVYGLGCHPLDPIAINRLLSLKQRPSDKGLILIASDIEQLTPYIDPLPEAQMATVTASWPGPHTWLLPAAHLLPHWLTGGRQTLAVRVTAHPQAAALCHQLGSPLISTSANPSSLPPARSPLKVQHYFGNQLDGIIHGTLGNSDRPTTIHDAFSGHLIRR
ncbi:MAG: threonylcarbamoyl-AMP synthase [Gammaproteobacteria bacterium]|nr:threonylcarbamoyl-AMP synthase [Gammaproteobacteria bacterium]